MYARDIDIPSYDPTGQHRLTLVKPAPSQATITIEWLRRDNVTQYLGEDFSGTTLEDEIEHLESVAQDPDCYSWMIELDGIIVGNIEINEIKKLSEKYGMKAGAICTLIGSPDDWGKGLGSRTKQAACHWAFTEGGFEIIEAKAYVQNERSWKVLEKYDYHYEGIEKATAKGQPVKWKVYTLKKSDWEKKDWATI